VGPDRTTIICDWLFEAETMAKPDFDPSDEIAFWDLTNGQDWHVCELQQRGTRSSTWVAGRYSNQEFPVHNFDRMVVDRYVGDPFLTTRVLRERGEAPAQTTHHRSPGAASPDGGNGTTSANGKAATTARTAARAKATTR